MDVISERERNYLPYDLETRLHSVKRVLESGWSIKKALADLAAQGARWNKRYNEMPRMVLKLRSPNQVELEKLKKLMQDTGEVRCPKLLKCFTSIEN